MRNLLTTLLICITTFVSAFAHDEPTTLQGLTQAINAALSTRKAVVAEAYRSVDSLRALIDSAATPSRRLALTKEIVDRYATLNTDSLIDCCNRAIAYARLHDNKADEQYFKLVRAAYYPKQGIVKEAMDDYNSEAYGGIMPENRQTALETGCRMYLSITDFYPTSSLSSHYLKRAAGYADSLSRLISDSSPASALFGGFIDEIEGRTILAKASYLEVIENPEAGPVERKNAAFRLAGIYDRESDDDNAIHYYALSALIALRHSSIDSRPLQALGNKLYERGDIETAFKYLNSAMQITVDAGNKVETMAAANTIPQVSSSYTSMQRRPLRWLIILATLLIAAVVALVVSLRRSRKNFHEVDRLKSNLKASDKLKEEAISNFILLSSMYIERMDDFSRLVRRKISAGQIESLYDQVKTDEFLEQQNSLACRTFDDTFLKIFPTFITDLNTLLQPDKQVISPREGTLTTELRILAFMRLGIEDTQKIARLLGLSLNTIYTYRNKFRSRACNRDTFEADVMNIGRIA